MPCCRRSCCPCCGSGGARASGAASCCPMVGCSPGGTLLSRFRRASSTGLFMRRRRPLASRSVSARTRCATASPPTCSSRMSTSALSRFCSERRHTAHEHLVEGRIYYRFHPRCGETVLINRQLEHRSIVLVVILQPDSSLACIPLWMTHEAAAQYTLSEEPRFSVDILRSLRAEINALLGFLQPKSKAEEADNVAPIQRSPTNTNPR